MWIYSQTTGEMRNGDIHVATGYSGLGRGKNNPGMESISNVGPIPRGHYTIGTPRNTKTHGPIVMRLLPAKGTETHGRDGFLIHGDSIGRPGTASHGCIILDRMTRLHIAAAPTDNELLVTV